MTLPASPEQLMGAVAVADLGRWAAEVASKAPAELAEVHDVAGAREYTRRARALVAYVGARTQEGLALREVQVWAERRLGQLLASMERHPSGPAGSLGRAEGTPPTLADLGISYDESSRAQQLAEVSEPDVRRIVDEHKAQGHVSPIAVARQAREERNQAARVVPDPAEQARRAVARAELEVTREQDKEVQQWMSWLAKLTTRTPSPEAITAAAAQVEAALGDPPPWSVIQAWRSNIDSGQAVLAQLAQRLRDNRT